MISVRGFWRDFIKKDWTRLKLEVTLLKVTNWNPLNTTEHTAYILINTCLYSKIISNTDLTSNTTITTITNTTITNTTITNTTITNTNS